MSRKSITLRISRGLVLIVLSGLVAALGLAPAVTTGKDCGGSPCPGTSPAIWPDRSAPLGDTVTIYGWNLQPSTDYDVVVIRPDGSIVWGDGSGACPPDHEACWDVVTTDPEGELLAGPYEYMVTTDVLGVYEVRLYAAIWSGDLSEPPIAMTSFFHNNFGQK